MHKHLITCIAATLLLAGCATFQPPAPVDELPTSVAPTPFPIGRKPVALVLSGGSARGYAHIGVIRVLEANGLRPDIIVGTSAGSIVGALYASGLTAAELDRAIAQLDASVFNDFVLPGLSVLPGEMGFVRGEKLHRFIDARVRHHHIQDFPIRFAAVATELATGRPVAFNAGDAGLAVLASCAVPGVITPVVIGRSRYSDGQISSPLPVATARSLGAKVVIAVDVTYPPEDAFVYSAIGVLFQSFTASVHRLKEFEKADADLVIVPAIERTASQFSFADQARLVAVGERAATSMLPAIRAAFAGLGASK
jgi:NTE family protein